jgi:hypothetical protein
MQRWHFDRCLKNPNICEEARREREELSRKTAERNKQQKKK